MEKIFKVISIILFIGAFFGLGLSGYGVVSVIKHNTVIQENLINSLDLVKETLTTTNDGLNLVSDAITKARTDIDLIETLIYDVSDAIGSTRPTLDTVSNLFGEDLLGIVDNTQTALDSAESSAILIDDTLKIISAIPLIGARYSPTQPLGESIGQIAEALDSLPESLTDIEEGLGTTSDDLYLIEDSVTTLAERIGEIDSNLEDANSVIDDYHTITQSLMDSLTSIEGEIPGWFKTLSFGISFVFAWIGIASLGLFSIGVILWRQEENSNLEEDSPKEQNQ